MSEGDPEKSPSEHLEGIETSLEETVAAAALYLPRMRAELKEIRDELVMIRRLLQDKTQGSLGDEHVLSVLEESDERTQENRESELNILTNLLRGIRESNQSQ